MATTSIACTLKSNDSAGWALLTDSIHAPIGVASISVNEERIRVTFTAPFTKIAGVQAHANKAFESTGYFVSFESSSLSYVDIYISKQVKALGSRLPASPLNLGKFLKTSSDCQIHVNILGTT